MGRPILQLRDYGYAYPERDPFTLRHVDLRIEPGQCHCLLGPTGSGKTTLILALKGLLPGGREEGTIAFSPESRIGLVLQNPETQLLTPTVGPEVAFGLENLCVEPDWMPARVQTALAEVGLEKPLDLPVEQLSMGQQYRLLLAASLVMEPDLLALDEPSGQLDPEGLEKLLAVIRRLKSAGVSFLLCEHSPAWVAGIVDQFWRIDAQGSIRAVESGERGRPAVPRPPSTPQSATDDPKAVDVEELTVNAANGEPLWPAFSLSLFRGECAALCGPNGIGKTTLLRLLAGFLRPDRGSVRIFGEEPRPERLRGRVGCLFQNPAKQLFESTVYEEVAFSPRRLGLTGEPLSERVRQTLALCRIEHLATASPHKLSYGQKHLVGLASILAMEPDLLLLDDPFAGLDPDRAAALQELLHTLSRERGTAILWTTHHPRTLPGWIDRTLFLRRDDVP